MTAPDQLAPAPSGRSLLDRVAPMVDPGPRPAAGRSGGDGRATRFAVLAGLAGLAGYVFLADPDGGGAYPACPSQRLLGLDCPACGGLRGTNALLHGRVAEALDHNLLLPLLLGGLGLVLALWLLPLVGRAERRLRVPAWAMVAAVGLLAAFAVARNLPVDSLDYLSSDA